MGREIDVEDIVEQHWPYDGPHTDEKVIDALSATVQLIRYANNATHRRMTYVASVYSAVSMVHAMVSSLEQLFEQLAGMTADMATDPDLYDDRYSADMPADQEARIAANLLGDAAEEVDQLAAVVSRANSVLVHLGHR